MLPSDDVDGLDVQATERTGETGAPERRWSGCQDRGRRHNTDEDDFKPTRADGSIGGGTDNLGPVLG